MKKALGFLFIAAFAAIVWMTWQIFLATGSPPQKGPMSIYFEINKGMNFRTVANQLEERGFIRETWTFSLYARFSGFANRLKVGEYQLDYGMSPYRILQTLSSGKSVLRPLMFQEGINLYEIAAELERLGYGPARKFIELCHDRSLIRRLLKVELDSLEGYLFPETYHVSKYISQASIVEMMVKRFLSVYTEVMNETKGAHFRDRHKVVVLASIVEKETGVDEERPRIASVFANRLRKGMRLQSDPTILYGILEAKGEMKRNITRQDILEYTPYNTYRVQALPKGPIANPGRAALRAVLNPENSNFLYFVSRNDGTHVFSENLEDHNRAVRTFQLDRKAREGKSWRDLKNRQDNKSK